VADNKAKRGAADRRRVASGEGYEVSERFRARRPECGWSRPPEATGPGCRSRPGAPPLEPPTQYAGFDGLSFRRRSNFRLRQASHMAASTACRAPRRPSPTRNQNSTALRRVRKMSSAARNAKVIAGPIDAPAPA